MAVPFPSEPSLVASLAMALHAAAASHLSSESWTTWMEHRLPQLLLITETVASLCRHLGPEQGHQCLEILCLAADVLATLLASTTPPIIQLLHGDCPPIIWHPTYMSFRDQVFAEFSLHDWRGRVEQTRTFIVEAVSHVREAQAVYACNTPCFKLFRSLLCVFDDTALQLLGLLQEPNPSTYGVV